MEHKKPISEGFTKAELETILALIQTGRDILDGSSGEYSYDDLYRSNKSNIEVINNNRDQLLLQLDSFSKNNATRYTMKAIENLTYSFRNQ